MRLGLGLGFNRCRGGLGSGSAATTISVVAPAASGVVYPTVQVSLVAATNSAGTVEFFLGAVSLGTAAVSGGLAILSWTPLYTQWGASNITAVISGTTSAAVAIQVGPPSVIAVYVDAIGYLLNGSGVAPINGDVIATWNSATGSNNATAASNRPTWVSPDAAFNNDPSVAFASASSQRMIADGLAASFAGNPGTSHTLTVRMKPVTLPATATFFSCAQTATAVGSQRWFSNASGNIRINVTGDGGSAQVSSASALAVGLAAGVARVFSCQYSNVTRVPSAWANGVRFDATAMSAAPGQVTPNNGTIGATRASSGTAEASNANIAELWVDLAVDNTNVRETIESLMLAKQGSPAPGVGEYDTSAYGIHNFTASGRYVGAALGSIPRSVGVVFRSTVASATSRVLLSAYQTDGWEVTLLASGAMQITGATGVVTTGTVANDGSIHGLLWTYDGAGNHVLYLDRGAGQGVAGVTVTGANHELCVGSRSEGYTLSATGVHVLGFALSTSTAQTQDNADQWFDESKAIQGVASLVNGPTQTLDTKAQMSDLVPDATWAAALGSSLTRYGTVSVREIPAAVISWGWV